MSPSVSVPNGVMAQWPSFASDELTTIPFLEQVHSLVPNLAFQTLMMGRSLALALLILAAVLPRPSLAGWSPSGPLNIARAKHTATLLPNGKVLVSGGYNLNFNTASTELYDPITGIWSITGNLAYPREAHTATLLRDGRVLVAEGAILL